MNAGAESRVVPCASNVCGVNCVNTVVQTLDTAGVFRPTPPLCDACKAELAANAASWRDAMKRARILEGGKD
jgi:hypothetical protein